MNRIIPLLMWSLVFLGATNLPPGWSAETWDQSELHEFNMRSGDSWSVTPRDAFIIATVFLMLFDLARARSYPGKPLIKHALSVGVLVVSTVMVIDCRGCGNATFGIFIALAFFDLIAGIIITMALSHRHRPGRRADEDD
jgi:hypothetical protein